MGMSSDFFHERAEPGLGNAAPPNPHFVGRAAELRRLRESLVQAGTTGVVTSRHGLAGLGKTALALEYARAYAQEYGGGCWQVRCAGRARLRDAMATLAPALGIDFADATKVDGALQFQRILTELRCRAEAHEPHRCLLLLENVDQPGFLDPEQSRCVLG